MFEVGDKIICLDDADASRPIKKFNIYNVKKINTFNNCILLEEIYDYWFDSERFILFSEFRRTKIEKIKERINGSR